MLLAVSLAVFPMNEPRRVKDERRLVIEDSSAAVAVAAFAMDILPACLPAHARGLLVWLGSGVFSDNMFTGGFPVLLRVRAVSYTGTRYLV